MSRLDELIEKLCPDGVEMHELQELFTTRNGYTPSKSKSEFWENGTVPWFKMEDIRANGNILSDALQHVNECAVKGQLFPENSIIVATSATVGEHALITVPSLANQRFTYLMVKPEYEDKNRLKLESVNKLTKKIQFYKKEIQKYIDENMYDQKTNTLKRNTNDNRITLITCIENMHDYRRCVQAIEIL